MIKKFFFIICFVSLLSLSLKAESIINNSLNPINWEIKNEIIFDEFNGPKDKYFKNLFLQIESYKGEGKRFTINEFKELLKRPESKKVYTKELIRYATPESVKIQNKAHRDFSKIFMKEKRIRAGVDFLKKYDRLLSIAEKRYRTARQDIVSILMWESGLGTFTGNLRIFNVFMGQLLYLDIAQEYAVNKLLSQGKNNPLNSYEFAQKEKKRFEKIKKRAVRSLAALLRQSKVKNYDPLKVKGSWGGAIGYVQFMPYRMNFAVDGDNDGSIDLHSWPDAILSVANYLKEFGDYNMSYKGRKRGIYSYNHSNSYVRGVILFADTIWKAYRE